MIDRLLKMLVQDVPEELSVCEFDCPRIHCYVSDWTACELRYPVAPNATVDACYASALEETEASANGPFLGEQLSFWPSK
jgi:hypothetical protein